MHASSPTTAAAPGWQHLEAATGALQLVPTAAAPASPASPSANAGSKAPAGPFRVILFDTETTGAAAVLIMRSLSMARS